MSLEFFFRYVVNIIVMIVSLSTIIFFIGKAKKNKLFLSFIWFQSLMFTYALVGLSLLFLGFDPYWSTVQGLEAFPLWKLGIYNAVFIAIAWLLFSLYFSEHKIIRNKFYMLLIWLPPILIYGITLFQPTRQFYFNFNKPGIVFYIQCLLNYIYATAGTVILFKYSFKTYGYKKKQSMSLLIFIVIPLTIFFAQDIKSFVFHSGLLIKNVSLITPAFLVSSILVGLITFKYRFLNIVPLAYTKIVNSLTEPIMIIDFKNKIIGFNQAFKNNFIEDMDSYIDRQVNDILPLIAAKTDKKDINFLQNIENLSIENFSDEIVMYINNEKRFYNVSIQMIEDKNFLGRIISFSNMTEYRKNIKELTLIKERNRFAGEIHDTVGHTLTSLSTILQVAKMKCNEDTKFVEEKLNIALQITWEGVNEIRSSIAGIKDQDIDVKYLVRAITNLNSFISASDVKVDFTINKSADYEELLNPMLYDMFYKTYKESITNSLKHGRAKNITSILQIDKNSIRLFIADDGIGCKEINKGFGIIGMERRASELNAKLSFGTGGEKGFSVLLDVQLNDSGRQTA